MTIRDETNQMNCPKCGYLPGGSFCPCFKQKSPPQRCLGCGYYLCEVDETKSCEGGNGGEGHRFVDVDEKGMTMTSTKSEKNMCLSCETRPASTWCNGCIVEDHEAGVIAREILSGAELDSPNFVPAAASELAARDYKRINNPRNKARIECPVWCSVDQQCTRCREESTSEATNWSEAKILTNEERLRTEAELWVLDHAETPYTEDVIDLGKLLMEVFTRGVLAGKKQ